MIIIIIIIIIATIGITINVIIANVKDMCCEYVQLIPHQGLQSNV
jgi:hypothetical protein